VFDSSGQATARPHVGHRFYTSALIRYKEADKLARDVPAALVESRCVAVLNDLRYSGLPESLRNFIEARYQPLTPDLWLFGVRMENGPVTVPQTGTYLIHPENAFAQVRIDGQPLSSAAVTLERGEHLLQAEIPGVFLLWLPRDGVRWAPISQRGGTFSRLF
jgi:hypothetical protein